MNPLRHWLPLLPPALLALTAIAALLSARRGNTAAQAPFRIAVAGCLAAFAAAFYSPQGTPFPDGAFSSDRISFLFGLTILAGGIGVLISSRRYVAAAGIPSASFCALAVMALAGCWVAVATQDLGVAFVGLETAAICGYPLVGMRRDARAGAEGSLKYFLFGGIATAFLAYGLALLYYSQGTLDLGAYLGLSAANRPWAFRIGALFLGIGLALKAGAAPFHLWVPDVYQGAPLPVTTLLSTVYKVAAIAVLYRFVVQMPGFLLGQAAPVLWGISALTMTLGNLVALRQRDFKRMLAYSSVGHTGYLLMGVLAYARDPQTGALAIGLYAFVYVLMGLASFGMLGALSGSAREWTDADSLAGLARREPTAAICLAGSLLSLAGFPPTAGFLAKFVLFAGGIHAGLVGLVAVAAANTLISLYYYLKALAPLYMRHPAEGAEPVVLPPSASFLGGFCTLLLLTSGVIGPLLYWLAHRNGL